MSEVEAAIWGAVAGGALGLITAYAAYRWNRTVSTETMRIGEFNKAAAEFRAAFLDEEYRLRKCDLTTYFGVYAAVKDMNENIIITHEKARILFEPFIDKKDIPGFSSAWEIYTNTWPQYLNKYEEDKIPDFLGHYYSFMSYAQPK